MPQPSNKAFSSFEQWCDQSIAAACRGSQLLAESNRQEEAWRWHWRSVFRCIQQSAVSVRRVLRGFGSRHIG